MTNNLMSQFNIKGKVRTKNGTPIGELKRAFKSTKTMPAIEGIFNCPKRIVKTGWYVCV